MKPVATTVLVVHTFRVGRHGAVKKENNKKGFLSHRQKAEKSAATARSRPHASIPTDGRRVRPSDWKSLCDFLFKFGYTVYNISHCNSTRRHVLRLFIGFIGSFKFKLTVMSLATESEAGIRFFNLGTFMKHKGRPRCHQRSERQPQLPFPSLFFI